MDADKEQITEVLIRYATGIDSKDWPLFRSCWADEVDLDYGELGEFTDPDAFTDLSPRCTTRWATPTPGCRTSSST